MIHLLLVIIYIAFISLGLPDSLLGAAWPSMFGDFSVPVSYAGIVSMIISAGTIASSLLSDRLNRRLGTGRVTAASVAMTACALLGFSVSGSFPMLCLWAVPYGLGAGSVDAALNNYVALHYASRHMSWLHCMWGIGTVIGPSIMGYMLTHGGSWNSGYRAIFLIQAALTVVLIISLPLWKINGKGTGGKNVSAGDSSAVDSSGRKPMPLLQVVRIPGAKEIMVTFFCYCAGEGTAMLWASSYMVLHNGISAEAAAGYAGLFFIGITAGRFINGFLTFKFSDVQMIRAGQCLLILGALILLLPFGQAVTVVGIVLFGLGCAPIYPCIIHSTPERFGAERSQALIGVQMASAYVGSCFAPPIFGLIADNISVSLFPVYLLLISLVMVVLHERLIKKTRVR